MIVVIQCAGSKRKSAGYLKTQDGRPVFFVSHPELASASANCVHARPDDASDAGGTWRDRLVAYNANPGNNPLGLLPAFELYENDIYRALVKQFGVEKTYIHSAGWGLINAVFFTPAYDITFSTPTVAHNAPLLSLISTLDASATLFMNSTDASVVDRTLLSPDIENVYGLSVATCSAACLCRRTDLPDLQDQGEAA